MGRIRSPKKASKANKLLNSSGKSFEQETESDKPTFSSTHGLHSPQKSCSEASVDEGSSSLIQYGFYSPRNKSSVDSPVYILVSSSLTVEELEQYGVICDFLNNMILTISGISRALRNPELRTKMSIFEADLQETKLNLEDLLSRDWGSLSRIRGDDELRKDILNTFSMIKILYLQRGFPLIDRVKNKDLLVPYTQNIEDFRREWYESVSQTSFDVRFSQGDATDRFKNSLASNSSSSEILGEKVNEVGEKIQSGTVALDVLKVRVFSFKGQWVAENNRGYAAACVSGEFPERILPTFPDQLILNTYEYRLEREPEESFYSIQLLDAISNQPTTKVEVCEQWRKDLAPKTSSLKGF